jgi:23S rRNA-/tRNA-specific pseudouridylate synthase
MAIIHQIRRKYASKNEEIVADLLYGPGIGTEQEMDTVIKRKAAEISIAMAILHGGEWRVEIDHENCFVLIAPQLPS